MAKKLVFPPPKDDVPPWFMTYSDVITLLMTFFILLMTFATTEPEKFNKAYGTAATTSSATGVTGDVISGTAKDSWVGRIRPPAARVALRGAEMPPIMSAPTRQSFGKGLQTLPPEELKANEFTSHQIDLECNQLWDTAGEITPEGRQFCSSLAALLCHLPFQADLQIADTVHRERVTKLMEYLFQEFAVRPGQLGMSVVRQRDLSPTRVRLIVTRYVGDAP